MENRNYRILPVIAMVIGVTTTFNVSAAVDTNSAAYKEVVAQYQAMVKEGHSPEKIVASVIAKCGGTCAEAATVVAIQNSPESAAEIIKAALKATPKSHQQAVLQAAVKAAPKSQKSNILAAAMTVLPESSQQMVLQIAIAEDIDLADITEATAAGDETTTTDDTLLLADTTTTETTTTDGGGTVIVSE